MNSRNLPLHNESAQEAQVSGSYIPPMGPLVQQFGDFQFCYATPLSNDGWSTAGVSGGANGTFTNVDTTQLPTTDVNGNPATFLPMGSLATTDTTTAGSGFLCLLVDDEIVVPSIGGGWTQVWNTADVSGGANGYYYEAQAPDGYLALGGIFSGASPCNYTVACVRMDHLVSLASVALWSTAGISGGANLTLVQDQGPVLIPGEGSTEYLIPSSSFLSQGAAGAGYLLRVIVPTNSASQG